MRKKPRPGELIVGAAYGVANAALPLSGPCPGGAAGGANQAIGHRCHLLACAFGTRKLRATGQRRIVRDTGDGIWGTFFTFLYFACEAGLAMIVVLHAKTITNRYAGGAASYYCQGERKTKNP
jgi:hypothetical protein